jgi:drug/metabolite transporter (DMT)-like permease
MNSLIFALLSVLATALLRITLKHCAVSTTSPWTTLALYNIGGVLVLLPFLGLPSISEISGQQILLLVATGVFFSLGGFLDILAMKHIDASSGEVFHTLTFIVSVAAGFLMFHEACSLCKIAGILVIAAGIAYEARKAMADPSRAFGLKLASAALIASAMVITKYLTTTTSPEVIIYAGFLLPGLMYIALGAKDLPEISSVISSSNGRILLVPVLGAASYTFGVKALAAGEMSTTYIIFQSTISAVFALELLLHGWKRDASLHRAVSASLCMCGALIAILG